MTEKRFTVHIRWFNYDKTEGDIELFDNGQPLLISDSIDDVQYIKKLLNKYDDEYNMHRDDVLRLEKEIEQLQERNNRQYERLGQLYDLIEKQDWESLSAILGELKKADEQLQNEWGTYEGVE